MTYQPSVVPHCLISLRFECSLFLSLPFYYSCPLHSLLCSILFLSLSLSLSHTLTFFLPSPLSLLQIGDYLLTLPQQIEPFTSMEDPALVAAMENSHLPYINNNGNYTVLKLILFLLILLLSLL